ncbi:uncharacterized protein [uncultured Mediterranean phage uvMED]|nr:uncharacterized protein [uncultured Mediterranean phage uvMED]
MTAKIKLNAASGGGSFSLQAPSSSSNNRVFTLPDVADGTIATTATAGKIKQWVSTTKKGATSFSVASGAISHYTDSTLRATITPTSASNFLYIMGHVVIGRDLLNWVYVGIGKDGADFTQGIGDASGSRRRATVAATNNYTDIPYSLPFHAKVTAESTSERYYNLCFSHGSGSTRTLYLNRGSVDTDNVYYPRGISTITVIEVEP